MTRSTEAREDVPEENIDFKHIPIVRDVLIDRDTLRRSKEQAEIEKARAEALLPRLNTALLELINASIESSQNYLFSKTSHGFSYRIPIENDEPIVVGIGITSMKKTRLPDIQELRSFRIYVSDSDESLQYNKYDEGLRMVHSYDRDKWTNRSVSRPATDDDVSGYTTLVTSMIQGLNDGSVVLQN